MARRARVVIKSKTADMVRDWIDSQQTKNQDDIAFETGFTRSNVLTMIKQGRTKMPLDKIESFAKACGRDPEALLKTALREYAPDLARLVGRLQGVPMFDGAEEIIDVFMTALTEVLTETREKYRDAASGDLDMQQANALNVQLDLSGGRRTELKKFVKSKLVQVNAGDEIVDRNPVAPIDPA